VTLADKKQDNGLAHKLTGNSLRFFAAAQAIAYPMDIFNY
jgi:hypothetical protein